MDDDEPAVAVSGGVSRAGWEPAIKVSESLARCIALCLVIARVTDVLMNDAVGIQVRCIADPPIPTTIMPS